MILRHKLGLNWRAKEFKFLWGNFRTLKCILKFYNYQNFIFSKKQTNKTSNNPNLKPKVYPRFLWWTTNMCCRQDSWGGQTQHRKGSVQAALSVLKGKWGWGGHITGNMCFSSHAWTFNHTHKHSWRWLRDAQHGLTSGLGKINQYKCQQTIWRMHMGS